MYIKTFFAQRFSSVLIRDGSPLLPEKGRFSS